MTPTTEHKGYKITFSDVNEDWDCRDLEMRNKRLPNLKAAIDRHLRKSMTSAVKDCYILNAAFANGTRTFEASTVTAIIKLHDPTKGTQGRASWQNVTKYAYTSSNGNRKVRKIDSASMGFYLRTPENVDVLAAANAYFEQSREAQRRGEELIKGLDRVKLNEHLTELKADFIRNNKKGTDT